MSETPGTLIGLSNVMTQASARGATGPDPDQNPALRERLRMHALRAIEGRESFIQDAVVLGKRVRLFSNSHHLADFWRENWFNESDWKEATGQTVPHEPALIVHAMIDVAEEPEASYVSVARQEVYLFNTSWYGDLRACAMEALGRLIGKAGFVVQAAAVEINGRGLALLYPKERIHPTPLWGLMELPGATFIADGWLALEPSGKLHALEKGVYFRTSVLESYPALAARVLFSKFENVPDLAPGLAEQKAALAEALDESARRQDPLHSLRGLPAERSRSLLLRLASSQEARAIVSAETLFGKRNVARSTIAAVAFAFHAGNGEAVHPAAVEPFPCPGYEIRMGAVPGHPREVARLIAAT